MNTRSPLESGQGSRVLSVAFNQDASYFAVGFDTGMAVYNAKTCAIKAAREFNAGIGLARMMGVTNFLGLVGGGPNPKFSQNRAVIWDDAKAKTAIEITTLTAVRGVQLSRERIVVVLQNSVRIYKFAKPPELVAFHETADNLAGLCALSEKVAAFPGRKPGHVQIVHLGTGTVSIVPAHSSPVRAVVLSQDGEMVATASETGTLIRIFSSQTCARLAEIRRGIEPAAIYSLAFSPNGFMIASTSDKGTLHIFDIPAHSHRRAFSQASPGHRPEASPTLTATGSSNSGGLPPPSDDDISVISAPSSSHGGEGTVGSSSAPGVQSKWGILGRIPLMPRLFRDTYSFASAPFDISEGNEDSSRAMIPDPAATLGTGQPIKGVIGWLTNESLVVVGGGRDAKWERFSIRESPDASSNGGGTTRVCVREGWRRYVGNG